MPSTGSRSCWRNRALFWERIAASDADPNDHTYILDVQIRDERHLARTQCRSDTNVLHMSAGEIALVIARDEGTWRHVSRRMLVDDTLAVK
jgi:hypothetical protein